MKLENLMEMGDGPNRFFTIPDGLRVWVGRSTSGGFPTFSPVVLNPGDEIHWLHGGMFGVKDGKVIPSIHLSNPDSWDEGHYHQYRASPTRFVQKQISDFIAANAIKEIPRSEAQNVEYSI